MSEILPEKAMRLKTGEEMRMRINMVKDLTIHATLIGTFKENS